MILQGLLKSLLTWFLDLLLSCYNYLSDALIQVFGMDLEYFMDNVPVTAGIMNIMLAVGWALLLGNLVFQAVRGMLSGIGVEADDPKILFGRSFLYGFLLLASRQICEIGMSITGKVIGFLQIPDIVQFPMPEESDFLFGGAWVLVILVDCVMIYQVLRLFLIIGERYVILVFLIILSPVAFGMGGSKQTEDITKGFIRLFGSACLMMVLNLVALKLMLSAMGGFQGVWYGLS